MKKSQLEAYNCTISTVPQTLSLMPKLRVPPGEKFLSVHSQRAARTNELRQLIMMKQFSYSSKRLFLGIVCNNFEWSRQTLLIYQLCKPKKFDLVCQTNFLMRGWACSRDYIYTNHISNHIHTIHTYIAILVYQLFPCGRNEVLYLRPYHFLENTNRWRLSNSLTRLGPL